MYSAIPVPQVNWENRPCGGHFGFLPLIGVLIGAIEWFWFAFCVHFGAAGVFYAVIAALIPLAVSGGIHLDGLCDTCDALCSFGDQGKAAGHSQGPARWRVWAALADGIPAGRGRVFCPDLRPACASSAGMHRICFRTDNGGNKVVASPCAKDSGLAHIFLRKTSDKRAVSRMLVAEFVLFAVLLGLWIYRVPHALAAAKVLVIVLVAWYAVHEHISRRVFGGVTGDLADSASRCRN